MITRIISLLSLAVFLSACGGSSSSNISTSDVQDTNNIVPTETIDPSDSTPDIPATSLTPEEDDNLTDIQDTNNPVPPETMEPSDSTPTIPAPPTTPEEVDNTTITSVEPSVHDFTSEHFSGSGNCAQCHDGMTDNSGEDLSIVKSWKTTMMANSARDPFWKAKVASEVVRNPGLSETIEGTCARCHMPMAHVEATFKSEPTALLGNGFLSPDNPHFDEAAEGVSCTLCHQIENTAEFGTEAATSGNFVIAEDTKDPKLYGPFLDPIQGPMFNRTGFTPVGSNHISDSALCGSCHDVKTPIIDASGNLTTNEFPEQMIYSEWQHSDFSQVSSEESCQSCHMPLASGKAKIATRPGFVEARDHFSKHQFVGANTVMLDILQSNSTILGLPVNDFSKTIDLTKEMLKSSTEIEVQNLSHENQQLSFKVRLENKTGHKFPSGFPSRRAWLHIQVSDSNGNLVFESGAINELGQISGVDADNDNEITSYEKHHDLITSADQVQVYESIMVNTDNTVNYTLLNSASYIKDNRLMPRGMEKNNIPVDISVQGEAIDDDNFTAAEDVVSYQLENIPTGSYTVKATLNYQSISYRFATDLFKDKSAHSLVNDFKLMYDKARFRHEEVVSSEASL